jgi:microcystin-dependent protein
LCNGAEVSRTTYKALFDVLGTAHGQGNGSTTFNLPDLRGRFLRGVDNGVGRDPDRGLRVAANTGGNAGDAVGSVQGIATSLAPGNQSGTKNTAGLAVSTQNSTVSTDAIMRPAGTAATTIKSVLDDRWGGGSFYDWGVIPIPSSSHNHGMNVSGDQETRPINVGLNFIIKF